MTTSKALLTAASGAAAGGGGLDVNDVFSIYPYIGNGTTTHVISNGLDYSNEGGIWITKNRDQTDAMQLTSTDDDLGKSFQLNGVTQASVTDFLISDTGYTIKSGNGRWNTLNEDYVSWGFRKCPKFFDCVTYTGDGTAGRTISHNLDCEVGMVIVKDISGSGNFAVYHRGVDDGTAPETYSLFLNFTNAQTDRIYWNDTAPTSTTITLGADGTVNGLNVNYIAFIFAHNNGDGNFGPDGDQDIIKCGSFTSDGNISVDLGFEPEWLLVKRYDSTGDWKIFDTMRGFSAFNQDRQLRPNNSAAESDDNFGRVEPTGFQSEETSGTKWIYVAIRKGPLSPPTDASNVFAIATRDAVHPSWESGFPVDFGIRSTVTSTASKYVGDKLTLEYYTTDTTAAGTYSLTNRFDSTEGWSYGVGTNANYYSWMWRRAPHYYDTVAYIGNGTSGHNVSHNLGVVPEMMWVKRLSNTEDWAVYHKDLATNEYLALSVLDLAKTLNGIGRWNDTRPTSSVFTLGNHNTVNGTNNEYVCHLFATVDGVSKVGSYTGTGSSIDIDCGFTSGARFVIIKRTDANGAWWLMDTERGIVSGTSDPAVRLDTNSAQLTGYNLVDPLSSGFKVGTGDASWNTSGGEYIFYAIA